MQIFPRRLSVVLKPPKPSRVTQSFAAPNPERVAAIAASANSKTQFTVSGP